MAFVDWVLNNPGYDGIEDPEEVLLENRPDPPRVEVFPATDVRIGDMGLIVSPVFNTDSTVVNGWQTLSGGGDSGGSTRPTDGMIYPRGQG